MCVKCKVILGCVESEVVCHTSSHLKCSFQTTIVIDLCLFRAEKQFIIKGLLALEIKKLRRTTHLNEMHLVPFEETNYTKYTSLCS